MMQVCYYSYQVCLVELMPWGMAQTQGTERDCNQDVTVGII